MANATVSRVGADNDGGDKVALFLKVFSGEVLAAFNEENKFLARTIVRSISSGKSAWCRIGPTLNSLLIRGTPSWAIPSQAAV